MDAVGKLDDVTSAVVHEAEALLLRHVDDRQTLGVVVTTATSIRQSKCRP